LTTPHHRPGSPPTGEGLRRALRWLSDQGRHDLDAVEEACRRFDLSPLDEEFLVAEARRVARAASVPAREGRPVVAPSREENEHLTGEGVRILESWNLPADAAVSIARARLLPGETSEWHHLADTVERYLVISGRGTVELGEDAPRPVGPGDVVFIPAGVAQRARCEGDEPFVFYCICTPRFEERNYRKGKPGS